MKPKIAFYWCAGCGGCDEAVLDLGEEILSLVDSVDIVFWPVALDFKERDLAAMPDEGIDICFLNGAIRTSEQERMALLLRQKSRTAVAFGACAHLGGIPGLANLTTTAEIFREVYGPADAPVRHFRGNGHPLSLPLLFDTVTPLKEVIAVDYFIPGCPPPPGIIGGALRAMLGPERPERGSVLAPGPAMCDECPRHDTHPEDLKLDAFRRVQEIEIDPNTCLLAQGLPCLGPATRSGCGARCISGNMPCTGCFGPAGQARDFGAKALCELASAVHAGDTVEIDRINSGILDPVGLLYRYSLPASFLRRKRLE